MSKPKQNFFDIGELTRDLERLQATDGEDFTKEWKEYEFLKTKINLAIAQQLSVISAKLSKGGKL